MMEKYKSLKKTSPMMKGKLKKMKKMYGENEKEMMGKMMDNKSSNKENIMKMVMERMSMKKKRK